jgi:hypothetical protein
MNEGLFEYNYTAMTYTVDGAKFTSDCNEIQFQNNGKYPLLINGQIVVYPPYSPVAERAIVPPIVVLRGQFGEIDRSQYEVKFSQRDLDNNTQSLVVIKKVYKNPNQVIKFLFKK